jgi:hypothetical protein
MSSLKSFPWPHAGCHVKTNKLVENQANFPIILKSFAVGVKKNSKNMVQKYPESRPFEGLFQLRAYRNPISGDNLRF